MSIAPRSPRPPRTPRAPRTRSAFAAAFLSLIFPGLGHAYAGAWARALGFAALPLLMLAALAGVGLRADRSELEALVVNPGVLNGVLIVNVVAFLYRAAAAFDAWNVTRFLNAADASGDGRLGRARMPLNPLSVAGLAAVVLVMGAAHLAVWNYDALALSVVNCINLDTTDPSCADATPSPNPSGGQPTDSGAGSLAPSASDIPSPIGSITPGSPAPSLIPWDSSQRLNILLVGSDQRQASDVVFNTDTMIVVSIDPKSKQVAMFQLPRDITGVPCPPAAMAVCPNGVWSGKINQWFGTMEQSRYASLWPGKTAQARGFAALKAILGNLYGLNIQYYVKVDFSGFKKAIDTIGGVQINVQIPVAEDDYPLRDNLKTRVYIPAGPQQMDGTEALIYARSRHTSDDFDRGHRQQRVVLSVEKAMDPQTVMQNLQGLVGALKTAVKTDVPIGDMNTMSQLLQLASQIDTKSIRSYVFAPPYFATNMWPKSSDIPINLPRVQQAVRQAFSISPSIIAQQQALSAESAQVWVQDGKGGMGLAANNAAYLEYYGMAASALPQLAATTPAQTTITVYNGAETKLPTTIKFLQNLYHATITTATNPKIPADIVVVIGRNGQQLTTPSAG